MTSAAIYLILIIHGSALWGLPQPYPSQAACDEAGARWDSGGPPEPGTRGHYCLPAAIVSGGNTCTMAVVTPEGGYEWVKSAACTAATGTVK